MIKDMYKICFPSKEVLVEKLPVDMVFDRYHYSIDEYSGDVFFHELHKDIYYILRDNVWVKLTIDEFDKLGTNSYSFSTGLKTV